VKGGIQLEKRVRTKEDLLKEKDRILELYNKKEPKSHKTALLTRKERKVLGIGKDEGVATIKYTRISSTKVKIVLDIIKGKGLDEAYAILKYTPKIASEMLLKLLKSAESNAVNNNEMDREKLYVADAFANQGPTMKRINPVSRGSANQILKRSSHVTVIVKERAAQ